jgi:hypothetical protein
MKALLVGKVASYNALKLVELGKRVSFTSSIIARLTNRKDDFLIINPQKQMKMKYEDLKDEQKVNVYIPAMNNFYNMEVNAWNDEEGTFSVSNFGCKKRDKIQGHEVMFLLNNQKDVDDFFYMHKGKNIKLSELAEVTDLAIEHFNKNQRSWIFR